jgi:hypothetical protein
MLSQYYLVLENLNILNATYSFIAFKERTNISFAIVVSAVFFCSIFLHNHRFLVCWGSFICIVAESLIQAIFWTVVEVKPNYQKVV